MKTTITDIRNMPTECWIFEKHTYRYHGMSDTDLPYTDVSNECLLKANNISYRKVLRSTPITGYTLGEVCEYWDSEVFEERDVSAPLFAAMSDHTFRYCEKNYTGKVVSKRTIEAANKLVNLVNSKIEDYNDILREVQIYNNAKNYLAGKACTLCYACCFPQKSFYEIDMNYDSFVIFGIRDLFCNAYGLWVAIFDKNKISTDDCIELKVPKHIAGIVIGKKGCNIKSWAEFLKVKYIKVIPV